MFKEEDRRLILDMNLRLTKMFERIGSIETEIGFVGRKTDKIEDCIYLMQHEPKENHESELAALRAENKILKKAISRMIEHGFPYGLREASDDGDQRMGETE